MTTDQDTRNPTTTSITWILNFYFIQCTRMFCGAQIITKQPQISLLHYCHLLRVQHAMQIMLNSIEFATSQSYILCTNRFIIRGRHKWNVSSFGNTHILCPRICYGLAKVAWMVRWYVHVVFVIIRNAHKINSKRTKMEVFFFTYNSLSSTNVFQHSHTVSSENTGNLQKSCSSTCHSKHSSSQRYDEIHYLAVVMLWMDEAPTAYMGYYYCFIISYLALLTFTLIPNMAVLPQLFS
jgi:hypothetical protein